MYITTEISFKLLNNAHYYGTKHALDYLIPSVVLTIITPFGYFDRYSRINRKGQLD